MMPSASPVCRKRIQERAFCPVDWLENGAQFSTAPVSPRASGCGALRLSTIPLIDVEAHGRGPRLGGRVNVSVRQSPACAAARAIARRKTASAARGAAPTLGAGRGARDAAGVRVSDRRGGRAGSSAAARAANRRLLADAAIDEVVRPWIREHRRGRDDHREGQGGPDAEHVMPVEVARLAGLCPRIEQEARLERGPLLDPRQPEIQPAQD